MMGHQLRVLFLDWVNNYNSVSAFAAANGLTSNDAMALIEMGRRYHENYVLMMDGY
tara:strand:- start:511 stop:678 length:168 start_codon:yes stop_codon:yes gene_type:complete